MVLANTNERTRSLVQAFFWSMFGVGRSCNGAILKALCFPLFGIVNHLFSLCSGMLDKLYVCAHITDHYIAALQKASQDYKNRSLQITLIKQTRTFVRAFITCLQRNFAAMILSSLVVASRNAALCVSGSRCAPFFGRAVLVLCGSQDCRT